MSLYYLFNLVANPNVTNVQAYISLNMSDQETLESESPTVVENPTAGFTEALNLIMERLASLESRIDSSHNVHVHSTPSAPKKNIKKKYNTKVKTETFDPYESDDSQVSNLSCISNEDDLKIIKTLLKPKFSNTDHGTKDQLQQLSKIQEKFRLQIPKLKYSENSTTDSSIAPTHNYGIWIKQLLRYYTVLSPKLAKTVKSYLSSIDVDDLINGTAMSSINAPQLPEEDYPLITRLSAMNAITESLSKDFIELASDSLTDIFPTLANIVVICAPNTQEDRTENLSEFYTLKQKEGEQLFNFGTRLTETRKRINEQYDTDHVQITNEQLYATFIQGVKKGAQSEAYAAAISALKLKERKSENLRTAILWLHSMCDRSKLKKTPKHDANMARTRGGSRGSRGGRGRGRGRGGKGKGNRRSTSEISGKTVWKDTYYKLQDDEGKDIVTRPVAPAPTRSSRPCFTHIIDGECNNDECPYNHEFNIVDLRQDANAGAPKSSSSSSSSAEQLQLQSTEVQEEKIQSASAGRQRSRKNEEAHISEASEDSDDFDYAYDLGFKHRASCATSKNYNNSKSTRNLSLNNCSTSIFNFISFLFLLLIQLGTTIIGFSDILVYIYLYLFDILFNMMNISTSLSILITNLLSTIHEYTMEIVIPTLELIGSYSVKTFLIPALNLIDSYSVKIFVGYSRLCAQYLLKMFMHCPPLVLYITLVIIVLFLDGRLFKRSIKFYAFGGTVKQAIYKIILDCGCTFTMSGDLALFVQSSLVEINEDVGLAESGFSSRATHKGKIIIDGKSLDALYVPDFKQTMVSMGQLERMGLIMNSSGNTRKFVTTKGETFLTFILAPNNLYPLLPSKNSESASNVSSKSKSS